MRQKFNAENERVKYRYFGHLRRARRLSVNSIDQVAAALADYERATDCKEFRLFRIEHADRYHNYLAKARNDATKKPLAKATISSRLAAVKSFFQWLSDQHGYRRLTSTDFEYFNNSMRDDRIAKATRSRPIPSVEQIQHILQCMPHESDVEKRDRAVVAFTLLSGARDNAIASLSLKHVDLETSQVAQDAREVRTKNAKTFGSFFFPVPSEIREIVADWIEHLRTNLHWGPDDPLFPSTKTALDANGYFAESGLARKHWTNAGPIRGIFKEACARAGLPYFNPHSFRNTLAMLGEKTCLTHEALKAWSQNLGHNSVLTTLMSYGTVAPHRQGEIFAELEGRASAGSPIARIEVLERAMGRLGVIPSEHGDAGLGG